MIPLAECQKRGIYRIRSRNLEIGVFDGDDGFIGIREKFGDRYLFKEHHHDSGAPFGTVRPLELIGLLPEEIALEEYLQSVDQTTLRQVDFSEKFKQEYGWGWYWLDTGKPDPEREIKSMAVRNRILFEYLDKLEER